MHSFYFLLTRSRHGHNNIAKKALLLLLCCSVNLAVLGEESSSRIEQLLAMDLRNLLEVEIATGSPVEVNKAPATTSVITAQQIKGMGARNLVEVLNTVPGMHVGRNSQSMSPKFSFRGIVSTFSPQTLIMVNGVSLKSSVRGDSHIFWGEFPIHSISRIEIVRGPHSALYGADAFSGVINIITKSHQDIEYSEVGGGVGSFGTYNLWGNYSASLNDWLLAFNLEYIESRGFDGQLDRDSQTVIDETGDALFEAGILPFNPANASFAPGNLNTSHNSLDMWFSATHPWMDIDVGLQERWNVGSGQGIVEALDPLGKIGGYRHIFQASFKPVILSENLQLEGKASYYGSSQQTETPYLLLPPGTVFGAFPDGLIGAPNTYEYTAKVEAKLDYDGFEDHKLTFGFGYDKQNLYRTTDTANFNPDLTPKAAGLVDISDTDEIFLVESARDVSYLFVQDIIQLSQATVLTAGFRYDDYSDVGSTFNPRLALVWTVNEQATAKVLYGRAFRAPSFAETLVTANPIALGNPNLKPEIINTYEMALNYAVSSRLTVDMNVFRYDISDFITFVPDPGVSTATAQNVGESTGYGIEAEIAFVITPTLHVNANYSWVKAIDDVANDDLGEYPEQKAYARANWYADENLAAHIQATYVSDRERVPGDVRAPLDGYTSIDMGISYSVSEHNIELELLARNIFDADVREPSIGSRDNGVTPVDIPNDIPQAGRSILLRVSKHF